MIGIVGIIFGFGAIFWYIEFSVQEICVIAQQAHPGDDLAALIVYMNSEEHSLKERNLAVWALGRLRNPRALPALEKAYTGESCDHDRYLCQYELNKAIRHCKGETSSLFFRDRHHSNDKLDVQDKSWTPTKKSEHLF